MKLNHLHLLSSSSFNPLLSTLYNRFSNCNVGIMEFEWLNVKTILYKKHNKDGTIFTPKNFQNKILVKPRY